MTSSATIVSPSCFSSMIRLAPRSTVSLSTKATECDTSTIQSHATGGVTRGTYLFALPGSPSAARDGWEMILKDQPDYRHRPCNFVELFPRLREHEVED
jgi:molybdenum cofactor biosynthesis protein B